VPVVGPSWRTGEKRGEGSAKQRCPALHHPGPAILDQCFTDKDSSRRCNPSACPPN
jgi:hypothetical protein